MGKYEFRKQGHPHKYLAGLIYHPIACTVNMQNTESRMPIIKGQEIGIKGFPIFSYLKTYEIISALPLAMRDISAKLRPEY
jgi:hypothetical protein